MKNEKTISDDKVLKMASQICEPLVSVENAVSGAARAHQPN